MLTTKHKPVTVGEILVEEFIQPMGLTPAALAEAMEVQRKHVNKLCNNRRNVTAATALILARDCVSRRERRGRKVDPAHLTAALEGKQRDMNLPPMTKSKLPSAALIGGKD
jgi:addiction module HigA family antidote